MKRLTELPAIQPICKNRSKPLLVIATWCLMGCALIFSGSAQAAYDVTIAASGSSSGGSWVGDTWTPSASGSTVLASEVATHLTNGPTAIGTAGGGADNGDIFVNSAVSWSANTLTLSAQRNIAINTSLNGSGAAQLALEYGMGAVAAGNTGDYTVSAPVNLPSGANFSTVLGSDGSSVAYTVINSVGVAGDASTSTLQGMKNNLSGKYALGSDIDAGGTAMWNLVGFSRQGFEPVGNSSSKFAGQFAGLGHTISDLTIKRWNTDNVGLFGCTTATSTIRDVGLASDNVQGNNKVGGLVGWNEGTVSNSYSAGAVDGMYWVGGLVGLGGTISNSYSTGSVSGSTMVGGLVGLGGTVSNSYSTSSVWGGDMVGGLVGGSGTVSNSYSTGLVIGWSIVGGLIGSHMGTVNNSYSTSDVIGDYEVGGLIGENFGGTISNSYSTGVVDLLSNGATASMWGGGLVGWNWGGTISNSYSTSSVSGISEIGGLVGYNSGAVSNSYSTGAVTGNDHVGGLIGSGQWGTVSNSHYDIDQVTINGSHILTVGGLYHSQYLDWINNGRSLSIADYAATLPLNGGSYEISSVQGLKDLLGFADVSGYRFRLTANLDMAATPGLYIPYFSAQEFDGTGHTISNLSLNQPNDDLGFVGLLLQGSALSNLGVAGGNISGHSYLGGLVGESRGTVNNSYSTSAVTGTTWFVGGLVGSNYGTVSNSYSAGPVSGNASVGGLVGENGASISNSYSTGSVSGNQRVGGLVGQHFQGSISNSYSTSGVVGNSEVGGLVGSSYYAGLETITNSYWSTETSGQATSDGGTGKNTTDMKQQATFSGWDFTNTWSIVEGSIYPLLRTFQIPLTVTANNASKTYDGNAWSGGNGANYSGFTGGDTAANLVGSLAYSGPSQGAIGAGSYVLIPSGYQSEKYSIIFVNGALTILSVSYTGATATGTGNATATVTGGGGGCGFSAANFVPLTISAPAGVSFPHGLFDFTLSGCTPGSMVTLNITYPSAVPAGTQYWKYGPTSGNATPHWYTVPANISGNTITFSITDGGLGDDDLTVNGAIVDQGGPGVQAQAGAPTAIPTLSEWGVILLAGMLGVIGMVRVRKVAV